MDRPRPIDFEDALVIEQFNSMTRNIPPVFVNILFMAGVFSWFIYTHTTSTTALWLAGPLVAVCGGRAIYWRNLGRRSHGFDVATQKRMLRTVWILCACLCVGFSSVVIFNLASPDLFVQATIAILVIATSIAIALHLFALPKAALAAVWSATSSTVFVFLKSGDAMLIAASLSLLVIAIAITRLLTSLFSDFCALVRSRAEIDAMREDALRLAMTDPLTGLPNRRMFELQMREYVESGRPFALAAIDLDGFKPVNDAYGHAVGDACLAEVARRLRASAGHALVARIGGDEFVLLLEGVAHEAEAVALAREAVRALSKPYRLEPGITRIGASCGVAIWTKPGDEVELVNRADIALYHAKSARSGRVLAYTEEMAHAQFETPESAALQRVLLTKARSRYGERRKRSA
ncbi:MAG: diguanylate cyclase [Hyphomicrobiales bacterium]|nr:diguanylate cyclase [Hyphomicrobiales bacterium]